MAFVLAIGGLAAAQGTTGTISGQVVDSQGLAVPGASVTVTGPQGARTFTTDGEGRYFAPFLTPGIYAVKVELQGFKASEQMNIQVSLGQNREVNMRLEAGGITETVQVTAAAPVIDTQSTTVGAVLDPQTLSRLPIGRSLAASLYIVPGVSDSSGLGSANPSIAGGSGLENNYIIDGVNITDVGFGGFGAFNAVFGSLGTGVTGDFIKETEVKTGGYEAEYGQATGGVVNVVTKSGSNNFNGSIFGYTRPSQLEAPWKQLTTPNGTVNTQGTSANDAGVSVGGRIVPNRLFFFGSYNPQWQKSTFTAPNNTTPIFPFAKNGAVDRDRRIQAYAAKLTAQLNSANRLDFSAFGDPSKGLSGLQRTTALRRFAYPGAPGTTDITGGFSELEYGAHNQTLRYDGVFGSKWLVEGSIARAKQKFHETPTTDTWNYADLRTFTGAACGLAAGLVCPQGSTGGLGSFENNDGTNRQYSVKSTNLFNGGGSHQVRYGVDVQDIDFIRNGWYSGPGVTMANGKTTVTGVPVQIRNATGGSLGAGATYYRASRGLFVPHAFTSQRYTSFFLQDTYQAGRLTIRPGIRYDRQRLEGAEPGNGQPVLCHSDDTRPGAGDGSGSAIPCTYSWKKNWAPRIGATYDWSGNGKTKIFANWGRFYAKIPSDLAARAMSSDNGITRQNFTDPGLTHPIPNGTNVIGSSTNLLLTSPGASIIEPGTGSTYTDEFVSGVEFAVLGNASLSFTYTHRTLPQIMEDIGQLSIAGYIYAPDTPVDYFITNVNKDTKVVQCCGYTNVAFEDPVHKYDAFEITLNKRFAGRWSAMSSYRYMKLRGNFEGFFRSDNGQTDPAISSLFDFPTNDPSYVPLVVDTGNGLGDIRYQGCSLGCGVLPNSRPNQLKLYGSGVWGPVNIGLGVNAGSGRSLTALAANPIYNNAGEIPMTLRGEGIQTSEGFKKRAPMDFAVDLHGDYTVKFGDRHVLLLADLFNLFDRRTATDYDNWYETSVGVLNPNFGQPVNGGGATTVSYQAPLSVRFGARFDW